MLNQLFSLSILEALQLRQIGYSYRRKFKEFCTHFKWLDLGVVSSDMDRKTAAEKLLASSGLPRSEWVVGRFLESALQ